MTGTILNGAGIVVGGFLGAGLKRQLSGPTQLWMKLVLGVLTIYVGLNLTWQSLGGGMGGVAKQMTIIVVAMILGRLTGRLLRIQALLNRLGQYAKDRIASADHPETNRFSDGFVTCSILFCVGPMAILGSLQDGLEGRWQTLGIKAVMDGLAAMAFTGMFGWGVILSAVPVVAYQGTLTLGAGFLAPLIQDPGMLNALNGTGGLLVFSVALIMFEIKRLELADYLPSLVYAPFIAWLWR